MDELNEQARAPHTQDLLIVHYKSHYTTGHSAELVPSLCVVDFGPAAARARFLFKIYLIVLPKPLPAAALVVRRR
jgi:hypothetical protein